jgi:hypothetical protein
LVFANWYHYLSLVFLSSSTCQQFLKDSLVFANGSLVLKNLAACAPQVFAYRLPAFRIVG